MTAASAIAAPLPGPAAGAGSAARRVAADAFDAMVDAATPSAHKEGPRKDVGETRSEVFTARPRPVADNDDRAEDDAADASEDTPAGLLTGAGLFMQAPSPVRLAVAETPVAKAAPGSATQAATPQETSAPVAPASDLLAKAADGPRPSATLVAAAETFAQALAADDAARSAQADATKTAAPATGSAASEAPAQQQTAAMALAAGLSRLLRPQSGSQNTTAPQTRPADGNASAKADRASTPASQPAPTSSTDLSAVATPSVGKADPDAVAATSQAVAAVVPGPADTPDRLSAAPLPQATADPATQSPTATATPQVAAQTPSVTPGLTASLSSLSHATIETTAQIAAQITRQLNGRSTRFEMGLTPEGLGRVDVRLDIDADGQLTARLAFDNPLAATDLRGRADELRSQLQDAGFKLAQDALSFSQRDPSGDGGAPSQRQNRAFAAASRVGADADLEASTASPWVSLSLTPRGVDMKV